MTRTNGHDVAQPPAFAPLASEISTRIRKGVGRLITGANELVVIALVSPVFLLGAYLAVEAASAGSGLPRDRTQRELDVVLLGAYGVVLIALAIRARLAVRTARRLLPDALSDDPRTRAAARTRMLSLAGADPVRRAAEWVASHGCLLVGILCAVAVCAWLFFRAPDPVWLALTVGTGVAFDVRWRALVADVVDQMPE